MKKFFIATLFLMGTLATFAQNDMPFYTFSAKPLTGNQTISLKEYKGKVVLVVNTASKCGFTPQYEGLETLYKKYKDRGLIILGFPANNFGGQEPGTNQEIQQFCTLKYNVSFPMFGKISVKGNDIHPLYAWLTSHPSGASVSWNFNKFLIGRDGGLIACFGSRAEPESEEIITAIEKALNQTAP